MNGICRNCKEPNGYTDDGLCKYCYAEKIGSVSYANKMRYIDAYHQKKKTAPAATGTVKETKNKFN